MLACVRHERLVVCDNHNVSIWCIGIFGNTTGLQTPQCNPLCNMESAVSTGPTGVGHSICSDNLCTAGYYCPEGSISGEEHECGSAGTFSLMDYNSPCYLMVLSHWMYASICVSDNILCVVFQRYIAPKALLLLLE